MRFCSQCGSAEVETVLPLGDIGIRHACAACGTVHYQNPNIVAACIATIKGRVLLCRRAIEPFCGRWTIPGGYLELGETVEEAARRETLEEAGFTLDELRLVALYNLPMFGEVYVVYQGEGISEVVTAGPESTEVRLFLPSEIPWETLAFPMAREALTLWVQSFTQQIHKVQSLDFFWGPEGAVRVRHYSNLSPESLP
jgi:ADP-ribose pyrophosphatase YjhB (NUDIX family)